MRTMAYKIHIFRTCLWFQAHSILFSLAYFRHIGLLIFFTGQALIFLGTGMLEDWLIPETVLGIQYSIGVN